MTWRVEAGARTSRGPGKSINEDAALIGSLLLTYDSGAGVGVALPPGVPAIVLIADGMGGHVSGEIASRLVAEILAKDSRVSAATESGVAEAVREANKALHERTQNDPSLRGMGSTVVGIAIPQSGSGVAFNVGDSRLLLRDRDLGVVQYSVDDADREGTGTGPELRQCLGGTAELTQIEPHVGEVPISDRDRLVLCSDGLTDVVSPDEIAAEIGPEREMAEAAHLLVELARRRGAHDDVTVVVVDITERA